MSDIEFTESQAAAIAAQGSVAVRAGAGSGKTAVLTQRYVRALDEGLTPADIVAITFTEKAAAEMRARIRNAIGGMNTEPSARARLQEQLAEAPISTIHAFCRSVLHEFPVEAGVDPQFEVLEEAGAQHVKRKAIESAIQSSADSEKHPAHTALELLLTFYPRRTVARMLGAIHDSRPYFPQKTLDLLELGPDELIAQWQQWLREAVLNGMDRLAGRPAVQALRRDLARLATQCRNHGDDLYAVVRLSLSALEALHCGEPDPRLEAASVLANALRTTDKPKRFGRTGKKGNWGDGALQPARDAMTALAEHARPLIPLRKVGLDETDRLVARIVAALWRLADEVERHYGIAKGTGRILDFSDLQDRTVALLRSQQGEAVLRRLRRRFRLVLVDEAQDLNLVQFDLLRCLVGTSLDEARNELFVVGDQQQSIFAFRNADLRLFQEIRDTLISRKDGYRALPDNFRSTPALVAFANKLFEGLMAGTEDFEVRYARMHPHRAVCFKSSIELLLPAGHTGPQHAAREPHQRQAAAVARRIAELVETGAERAPADRTLSEENLRKPAYGDIAILVRTRKNIPALLDALGESRTPCVVYKGIGFYQTQEVRDAYTCLRFLSDRGRDLDLAGLLRSPLFGLSDDALFLLAHNRGEASLCDRLLAAPPLNGPDREVIERARRLIPAWLGMVDRVQPSLLLHRILDETGAWGTYSAIGGGGTMNKLVRVLRGFQNATASLAQTVDLLGEHIRHVQREGDEPAEPLTADAVKIMTIHGAKGLEFPIVFVLGLDDNLAKGGGAATGVQIDADRGFAPDTPPALRDVEDGGAIYRLIGERLKRKELAESRRLLYVACTRAQDHLVLVGDGDIEAPVQSWQRWIIESLGLADRLPDTGASCEVELGAGALLRIDRRMPPPAEPVESREEQKTPDAAGTGHMDLVRLEHMLKPAEPERHSPTFSVTQLRDFMRCRRLYYVRHVLGLRVDQRPMFPEGMAEDDGDEEDGSGDQRVLGIIVRRLLEQFGKPTSTTLDNVARRAARNETLDDAKAEELAQRAVQLVRSFEKSEIGAALLKAGSLGELSFALRLDGAVVQGRIDRLITDAPPLVVDFKVPGDPRKVTRESLEVDYGLQLGAYALAASRLLGAAVVRAAIVLPETRKQFEWTYGAEEFRQVEGELVEHIQEIIAAERLGAFGLEHACGECAVCRGQRAGGVTRT